MNCLVTGATGKLAQAVIKYLSSKKINIISYSRKQKLDDVDWNSIDVVINCAARIPRFGVTGSEYFDSNVRFVEKLVPFCKGKRVVHFSTLSFLYRNDVYQQTKLIGDSILMLNKHHFEDLDIHYLPTLDDELLIETLVGKAKGGLYPIIDRLKYQYISYEDIAQYLYSSLIEEKPQPISSYFTTKDLYEEVISVVGSGIVTEGEILNRSCIESEYIISNIELFERFNRNA
ncbi:SDR family oxidoreductase [Vibrio lentus]|uniref:NAD-dependent epimerase/dehydratase domain-containing protein n=1 Tax=Vibrio lentus TaxID=136468 RepID=A0A855IRA9_9VIBR|nr:SDR family oxidoreductase [Vibrio lentus]PMJ62388.1 hypothetical protein BCU18_22860 [Vibrio lentus]PMJ90120.1 hypothetical protein BCU14_24735 [Vibrio lentus]PMM58023.1 hypothetical protein BCT50_22975 [Vibrio lentus]PMN41934.1 hypothetical protein BCT33_00280 [Vibrio lentus]PMN59040.1 hypothetical protein BCT29_25175 [Vibrio lentus]